MKSEWKKNAREIYLPKEEPSVITLPEFGFFAIDGRGNPNGQGFGVLVETLYSLSYAIKMSPKSGNAPEGYGDYAVFPLEGFWDISEEAKENFSVLDKDSLVYTIMIRQPEFVNAGYAADILSAVKKKKPQLPVESARFERLTESACVQMMHVGTFETEPASFACMEAFAIRQGLKRVSKKHHEIYISDPRRTAPEKMKTVLRFQVTGA